MEYYSAFKKKEIQVRFYNPSTWEAEAEQS
jgi:hypothetical protein